MYVRTYGIHAWTWFFLAFPFRHSRHVSPPLPHAPPINVSTQASSSARTFFRSRSRETIAAGTYTRTYTTTPPSCTPRPFRNHCAPPPDFFEVNTNFYVVERVRRERVRAYTTPADDTAHAATDADVGVYVSVIRRCRIRSKTARAPRQADRVAATVHNVTRRAKHTRS